MTVCRVWCIVDRKSVASPYTGLQTPATNLRALSVAELEAFVKDLGEPAFRGRQLYRWLWARGAASFDAMTDLPKAFRERLSEVATLGLPRLSLLQQATDGTLKALLTLDSGRSIETVLIPDFEPSGDDDLEPQARRLTVCVSSQVGCAMGCDFCATGTMGFRQNLDAGEIAGQVLMMEQIAQERFGRGVSNVVFMGMGEPLLNYDAVQKAIGTLTHKDGLGLGAKRITVSTVGLARRIRDLADAGVRHGLAVSLHAPFDAKRSAIMPVNRREATDLAALRDAIRYFARTTGQRVTYEYCMFKGFNDSEADARELAKIAAVAPSKVNLIMYNPVEGLPYQPTDEATLNRFIRILVDKGVIVTVRRSRGQEIDAACGQLAVAQG